jgi:hypothetical protein
MAGPIDDHAARECASPSAIIPQRHYSMCGRRENFISRVSTGVAAYHWEALHCLCSSALRHL